MRRWEALILLAVVGLAGCGKKPKPEEIKPLEITLARTPDGIVDRDYTVSITVSGGKSPYTWRVSAGELPAGLMLTTSTGALSGKPTAAGSSMFTIEVKDSASPQVTLTKDYTLLVAEPLLITTDTLADATVAVRYSVQLASSGGTGTVNWSAPGDAPPGLSLDPAGVLSGLPTVEGEHIFSVRATDSGDPAQLASKEFTLTVLEGAAGVVARASVDSMGVEANGPSTAPAANGDGHQVAFESLATNLVTNDTNAASDIFLFNLGTASTTRLSVTSSGGEANGASRSPAINAGATAVAFESDATNLIAADTNGVTDAFVRLIGPGATGRASVRADGRQAAGASAAPALSDDARFVAFASDDASLVSGDTNGLRDAFQRDRSASTTNRVSVGPGGAASGTSEAVSISTGGEVVAFESNATDVTSPGTSGALHVFIRAATTAGGPGTTRVVSVALNLPNTSADIFGPDTVGNRALALVPGEQVGRRVEVVSGAGAGQERAISFNTARTLVVTPPWEATPDATSVFRITSEGDALARAAAVSADGRFIAFESDATNLVGLPSQAGTSYDSNGVRDVFIHDRQTGITARVSVALQLANQTADLVGATLIGRTTLAMVVDEHVGRLVEIVAGAGAGQVRRVVRNDDLILTVDAAWLILPDSTSVFRVVSEAAGMSAAPAISEDGRFVAFESQASNLVAGDTNGVADIFVVDRETGGVTRVSVLPDGSEANGPSRLPALGRDGRFCAFVSDATNLVANDTNGVADIFVAFTNVPQP